ncbi:hypothetical protein KP509_37G022500 [Ceratopteris richardii]|uniref:Thioredoxin domain-containing protein n=1 Tax=Ceratopteris richardii TaxID=49495 RepID=A0A8T2Q653_CERRI|nr:hypothetical protein KP509_37G022500 [Ceratopteris richardii]
MAYRNALKLALSSRSSFGPEKSSAIYERWRYVNACRTCAWSYSTYHDYDRRKSGYDKLERMPANIGNAKIYLLGLGGFITIVGGYFLYHSKERQGPIQAKRPPPRKDVPSDHRTIGGHFKLVNQKGDLVTDRDLIGHWTLLYFGYTSCPDDCPEELQILADAIDILDNQISDEIAPVFITLDPKRDSAAQLQAYLSEFHPRIIGLTGSVDDIRQVARGYRVFYKKVEDEGTDYLVEHSNQIYLMDPDMGFVKFFGKEHDSESLVLGILEAMKRQ